MAAIIFSIVYLACLAGIVCYPKLEGRINGVKVLVMGQVAILCGQMIAGFLLQAVHVKAGLGSIGGIMLLGTAALWYGIWKKKSIQRLFWRKEDIISLLLLAVFVWLVSARIFGVGLELQYPSAQAAENFAAAMHMVRGQTVENAGFATVVEALFIQLCVKVVSPILCYKGFILADIFLHLMELWVLYVVILGISERKIVRFLAPFFCIAYFWGYPGYNYMMGNDDTFAVRSILILAFVYVLRVAVVRERIKKWSKIGRALLPVLFTLLIVGDAFVRSLTGISEGREIYASMYGDLIFFVPVFLYVCYYTFFKGKSGKDLCAMSVAMTVCTVILYMFWYQGRISNYNYYQNYAVLWLFGWLLFVLAISISAENGELPQFFSYAGFVGVLALMVLSGYTERVAGYDGDYVTKNFFSLYRYNADCLLADYGEYRVADDTISIYDEVLADYSEYEIPILTEDIGQQIWYDALTDNDSTVYSLTQYGLPEVVRRLEQDGVRAVVVQKDKEEYQEYQSYFKQCGAVSESKTAGLYGHPGENWTDIYGTVLAGQEEKKELFAYVKEELAEEWVPLMAKKEACLDFIMYEDVTGNDSSEFYTWKYNERENIVNLNAHDVKYVTLLKEDNYYIGNQGYYNGQDILFENEAGMVVRCMGEEWFLAE